MTVLLIDSFGSTSFLESRLRSAGIDDEVRSDLGDAADPSVWALGLGPETARMNQGMLDRLPNLTLLTATSAGTDHLDVAAAAARGITVTHTVDYCTDEVADHTLALILGLLRSIHRLDRDVRQGAWGIGTPVPRALRGITIGLWGYGLIGRAVSERASALGMSVQVCSRSRPDSIGWDELIETSDVLSVHVPLTDATRGVIGSTELARMKRGSYVVNVARGGIVDESALAEALASGHLGGAAVDTTVHEPLEADSPLRAAPNLVITPHAAWYSEAAALAPYEQFADAIIEVFHGRSPRGAVLPR